MIHTEAGLSLKAQGELQEQEQTCPEPATCNKSKSQARFRRCGFKNRVQSRFAPKIIRRRAGRCSRSVYHPRARKNGSCELSTSGNRAWTRSASRGVVGFAFVLESRRMRSSFRLDIRQDTVLCIGRVKAIKLLAGVPVTARGRIHHGTPPESAWRSSLEAAEGSRRLAQASHFRKGCRRAPPSCLVGGQVGCNKTFKRQPGFAARGSLRHQKLPACWKLICSPLCREWPHDLERPKPKKHGLVKKLKGHKHEAESRIRYGSCAHDWNSGLIIIKSMHNLPVQILTERMTMQAGRYRAKDG